MMPRTAIPLLLACLTLLLNGCASLSSRSKPSAVIVPEASRYTLDKLKNDLQDYRSALDSKKLADATRVRDRMIQEVRFEIDSWYFELEEALFEQRASFNTWADIAELGVSAAATLSNGERAKTILNALLTAGKGGRLSYDKNWYREKTTEVLMTAMRAERARVLTLITGKMINGDASKYSFEEARADLAAYFQAGTLPGGLLALSTQVGEKAATEQTKADTQEQERIFELKTASEEHVLGKETLIRQLKALYQAKDEATASRIAARLTVKPRARQSVFDALLAHLRAIKDDDEAALTAATNAFASPGN